MCDISIIIAVYNHECYIRQAIESVLRQKVTCTYEVLVGEDCSTDKSREILKEMETYLPSNFYIYYREYNYGAKKNFSDLYSRMKGKYFIVLEGDDFWNYEYKLQKQYDFLENHSDYIAVAHKTLVVGKEGEQLKYNYPECHKKVYSGIEFLKGNLPGQTTTILCRNYMLNKQFEYNVDVGEYEAGDRVKAFLLFSHGKIRCIQEEWSSYRYVLVGGSSYCANHTYRVEEFIPYYKGIYNYAKNNNDINANVKVITEIALFWELLKCSVIKKDNRYGEEAKKLFGSSHIKFICIFYVFVRLLRIPWSKIKCKMENKNIEKIRKKQSEQNGNRKYK